MLRPLTLLALVVALASCASFQFERQRVLLRYRPDMDVLDALLVYERVGGRAGVQGDQEKEDRESAEVIERIAQERRHFVLWDGFFEFDLAELVSELDGEDPLEKRFLDFEESIQVLDATLVHGPAQEPCLLQRFRVRNASVGLRLLDAGFNREILGDVEEGRTSGGDPATDALWLRRARENGSWARFDGSVLVISVPTTPHAAALGLSDLLNDDDDPWIRDLAKSLTSLEIGGEEALLRFAPGDDGWIRFAFDFPGRAIARGAQGILADRGVFDEGELEPEIQRLLALE